MASQPLELPTVGSYLRYKADTNLCLGWLLDAATAAGYVLPSPAPHNPTSSGSKTEAPLTLGERLRLKQERKTAKRNEKENRGTKVPVAVKHVVRTQELVDQAKVVAKRKVTVPPLIVSAFEQAIASRKKTAAWFQSVSKSSEQSNSQHQHFITLLENVLSIVRPGAPPPDTLRSGSAKREATLGSLPNGTSFLNRFEALNFEDIEDDIEDSTPPAPSTSKPMQQKPTPAYDFEFEDVFNTFDRFFAIACFFEDLHKLQTFVKETWQSHKEEKLDLQTASFVTNGAIAIARREEEDLYHRFFASDTTVTHVQLVKILRGSWQPNSSEEHAMESLMVTPFSDLVYIRTCHCIRKFLASFILTRKLPFAVPSITAVPIPSDQKHLFKLPAVLKGKDDDIYLTQMLLDLALVYCRKQDLKNSPPQIIPPPGMEAELANVAPIIFTPMMYDDRDMFSLGVRELFDDVLGRRDPKAIEPRAWLSFAAQIVLDIRDILGDETKERSRVFDEKLKLSEGNLCLERPGERLLSISREWPENEFLQNLMVKVSGSLDHPFEKMQQETIDETDVQELILALRPSWDETGLAEYIRQVMKPEDYISYRNETAVTPSKDPFLLQAAPLACGFRLLQLDLEMEQAGLIHANYNCTASVFAHLYNAARQTNILQVSWPDMEQFIQTYIGPIFGGKLPTKDEEFVSRYALKLGFLPSATLGSSRNMTRLLRGAHLKVKSGFRKGPQLPRNQINSILGSFYDADSDMNIYRCLAQLQVHFQENAAKSKPGSKAAHRQPQMSSINLLRLIRTNLPSHIQNAQVNLLTLTRACKDLCESICSALLSELQVDYSDGSETKRGLLFGMILGVLGEITEYGREESSQLRVAANIFQKHIAGLGIQ